MHLLVFVTALTPISASATAAVLPNNVAVTFTLCMSGTPANHAPCVSGSQHVLGDWFGSTTMMVKQLYH